MPDFSVRAARHAVRALASSGALVALVLPPSLLVGQAREEQPQNVDAAPRLRLVEEMRIGSAANPDTGFTSIGLSNSVDVDRDGQIYVYESRDARIRVYSPAGRLIRTIGRSGQGPGEFLTGGIVAVKRLSVVGDTIAVVEGPRISLFDRTGRLLSFAQAKEVAAPLYQQVGNVTPFMMRANGTFSSTMGSFRSSRGLPPARSPSGVLYGPRDTALFPRVVFSGQGAVIDTVGWDRRIPPAPTAPVEVVQLADGVERVVPRPPSNGPLLIVHTEGRMLIDRSLARTASGATFHVASLTLTGDTLYSRTFGYRPVGYAAATLDSIAADAMPRAVRIGPGTPPIPSASPAVVREVRARMKFPPFQPPVQATFVGKDGSLWLRRENEGRGVFGWTLLDPGGRVRGRFDIPSTTRLAWSHGDTVWAVLPDGDAVPWLVRYRIGP